MKCPHCNRDLNISNNRMESDEGTIDVFSVQTLVCVNPKCVGYAGKDLNNPRNIVHVARNKVN